MIEITREELAYLNGLEKEYYHPEICRQKHRKVYVVEKPYIIHALRLYRNRNVTEIHERKK